MYSRGQTKTSPTNHAERERQVVVDRISNAKQKGDHQKGQRSRKTSRTIVLTRYTGHK